MPISVSTLELSFDKGPRNGESLLCKPSKVTRIGRVVKGNTLAVKDGGISQKHLVLQFLPDISSWTVTDLDTSNGTLVNALPIPPSTRSPLADGDIIKIGETTSISVHISEASQAVAPPPTRGRGRSAKDPEPEAAAAAELAVGRSVRRGRAAASEVAAVPVVQAISARSTRRGKGATEAEKELDCTLDPTVVEEAVPLRRSTRRGKRVDVPVAEPAKEDIAAASEVVAVPVVARSTRRGKGATEAEKELDCALDPTVEEAIPLRSTRRGKRVDVPVVEPVKEDIVAASDVMAVPVVQAISVRSTRRGKGATETEKELDCALDPTVVVEEAVPLRRSTRRGKRVDVPVAELAKEDIAAEECGEEVTRGMGRGRGMGKGRGRGRETGATAKEPLDAGTGGDTQPLDAGAGGDTQPLDAGAGGDTQSSVLKEDGPAEEIGGEWENMTLEQWLDRMEILLAKGINEAADEAIAELRSLSSQFDAE